MLGPGALSLAALRYDASADLWLPSAPRSPAPPGGQDGRDLPDTVPPETLLLLTADGPVPDVAPDPKAADVWALGVLAATLVLGSSPFPSASLTGFAAVLGCPSLRELWCVDVLSSALLPCCLLLPAVTLYVLFAMQVFGALYRT